MKKLKEIACFETEYSSHQFVATVFIKEGGLIIDIIGPNDHLGGIGIGVPYIRKNGEESANFHCFSFPSHRDGELAGRIARSIAKITRYYSVVLFGIHFAELSKTELNRIIHFLDEWASEIGKKLIIKISLNSSKPI